MFSHPFLILGVQIDQRHSLRCLYIKIALTNIVGDFLQNCAPSIFILAISLIIRCESLYSDASVDAYSQDFVFVFQEIWTLCRIFKRTVTQRKCAPDWTQLTSKRRCTDKISRSMSNINNSTVDSCNSTITYDQEAYINFGGSPPEQKPQLVHNYTTSNNHYYNDQRNYHHSTSMVAQHHQPHQLLTASSSAPSSALSFWANQQASNNGLFEFENSWDELESAVQFSS